MSWLSPCWRDWVWSGALIVMLLFASSPSYAVDCCEYTRSHYGWADQTWYCIIDGQEYECNGQCEYENPLYDCNPPPCDGCEDWIVIFSWTGSCRSLDPNCDGPFALCMLVVPPPIKVQCFIKCQCD